MATERVYLVPLNLNKNELRLAVLQVLASPPSSPAAGQMYWDSVALRPKWYDGSTWVDLTSRANHSGTQLAATISDFVTAVEAVRLDQMAAPTSAVGLNGQKITSLGAPSADGDAATKKYVDDVAQGLTPKSAVVASTVEPLPTNDYANGSSGVGATLTGHNNGAFPLIDGQTLTVGQRVLVKDEATAAHNGVYTVANLGGVSAKWILTRALDCDDGTEIAGAAVFVETGDSLAATLWVVAGSGPYTMGSTDIVFTEFGAAIAYSAGDGLQLIGTTFSVKAGTGLTVDGTNLRIDTTVVVQKYAASVGNGSDLSYTVNHALGTRDVQVTVYDNASPYAQVEADVEHTDTANITVKFAAAPTSSQYRVVVFA